MVSKKDQEQQNELLATANRHERAILLAYLLTIQKIKDSINVAELESIITQGLPLGVLPTFEQSNLLAELTAVKNSIIDSYTKAGNALAKKLDSAGIYFNQVNPELVKIVDTWTNDLITNEVQAIIEGISKAVKDGSIAGVNPITTARKIVNNIGLTTPQQTALANYEKNLREGSRQAVNRALRDRRFDSTVLNSIKTKSELTEDKINKMVERYRQRMLKYRAETIARTESLRMVNMANQHLYENALMEGKIKEGDYKKFWLPKADGRTRHAHLTLPSMNKDGRQINEPFQSIYGNIMYPHDPSAPAKNTINCRCCLIYRLQPEAFM
jgi:hypothetical protein